MPTEAQIALKVLSDYWIFATCVVMLGGIGASKILELIVHRNSPPHSQLMGAIDKVTMSVETMAAALAKDAEVEQLRLEKEAARFDRLIEIATRKKE